MRLGYERGSHSFFQGDEADRRGIRRLPVRAVNSSVRAGTSGSLARPSSGGELSDGEAVKFHPSEDMDARGPSEQSGNGRVAHVEPAGIGAEGGQDQAAGITDKTTPADMAPAPVESRLGMKMAGDLAGNGAACRQMAEDEGPEAERPHGAAAEIGWRSRVVIAGNPDPVDIIRHLFQ